MENTNGMHYSVRDEAGQRWACFVYEGMANDFAARSAPTGALHVEHVRDCDCKHGFAS